MMQHDPQKLFTEENVDAAISHAIDHCSDSSITYRELFEAAHLRPPRWYFDNGVPSVVGEFMEALHFECERRGLPPFDALVMTAVGDRANYPGIGYFLVNGLSDPLDARTSQPSAKAALAFHQSQLNQVRAWCADKN